MIERLVMLTLVVLCTGHEHYPNADNVKNVHVVFMNHLDVGYDGVPGIGFINHILNIYFHQYFPRAIKVGQQLLNLGYKDMFKYTTHPWLVSMYLDCPSDLVMSGVQLKCPNNSQIASFKKAIKEGIITWHAGPMNLQTDNMPDWLFRFGIQLGIDLDTRFSITRKYRVLSQRDVPGITQAVIPSLVDLGVAAVSVGVNDMTAPPALPTIFNWSYKDHEVIAMWHPGGYPRVPGKDPKHPGGLSVKDCVTLKSFSEALCFAFRSDNQGPPMDVDEVLGYYKILQAEFPYAKIKASTFENFVEAVQPVKHQLPRVSSEISDSWIQGIGSDPLKCSQYRAVARVMGQCLDSGICTFRDPQFYNASRFLLKLPEHTWGLSFINDTITWTNSQLANATTSPILNPKFMNAISSWMEQRQIIKLVVDSMPFALATKSVNALKELIPNYPDLTKYSRIEDTKTKFSCGSNIIRFSTSGAIDLLIHNSKTFASHGNPLAKFVYITYNETDFINLGKVYNYNGTSAGYGKRNMTSNAHPASKVWATSLLALYSKKDSNCHFYTQIKMENSESHTYYGAPKEIWLGFDFSESSIDISIQWFDKTSTRLPEALMLLFKPSAQPSWKWTLSKMGHMIDPLNVVLNASHYQHGIDDQGIFYESRNISNNKRHKGIQFQSLDVPLVCPITASLPTPTVFPAPLKPITDKITGFAYNFYNNIWDTNYIYWYPYTQADKDYKARFRLLFVS